MLGILLAATVAAASATPPPAAHKPPCPAVRQQTTAASDRPGPKKLGELPDAELYRAVWKTAGGCPIDEVYQNGRWVVRWSETPGPDLRHAGDDAK